ncbi:TPA: hypothetical protein N0H39_000531 [Pseudomonas aeruginosa]|nr:hypothetical protein [Pseudomonas aeruginosa]
MRYYSKTTGCTYLSNIHSDSIPGDAIPITEDNYLEVIANPPTGKIRSHDESGLPILIDPPQLTLIEQCKISHARQISTINLACEAAITAGFQSAALGAPHQYSSQLDDQLNLTGAILRGLDMPYACRDEQGAKAFRLHTAEQLRQVGDDFTLYKLQLLQHANELKQQLDLALAAGDAEAMELISWEAVQP